MRQVSLFGLIALLLLGLGGCGAPRSIAYYDVHIPVTPAPTTYTWPIDVVVDRISGPELLQAPAIVFKTGSNQVGTYHYHRWVESPVEMVQAKLIRLLRTTGSYQSVSGMGNVAAGELVVRGRLYEFEEVDDERIRALVSMEFELYNRKTARVLWSQFYSQSEPVEAKQVASVVQALDRNLDRGLKEMIAGLNKYFVTNPPRNISTPSGESQNKERVR